MIVTCHSTFGIDALVVVAVAAVVVVVVVVVVAVVADILDHWHSIKILVETEQRL